jgi:hypothetical protein
LVSFAALGKRNARNQNAEAIAEGFDDYAQEKIIENQKQ